MDKKDISFLEQLLYNTDLEFIAQKLTDIDNPILLHVFAANYNWDDEYEIPKAILENKVCDLGTALLMFHYADGYSLLENFDEISSSSFDQWSDFIRNIYNKLISLEFKTQNISFTPRLTKVQKYKLKKNNPNIPDILINKSPGEVFDIPVI